MSGGVRTARMRTGIPGLDHLLEGGIVRGNSLLIEGPPGSGKTTFAVRMIYEGIAQWGEPGLIITFEEFPRQIYQEALGYGIDLAALEKAGKLRVVWTPPARILEGFTGKNDLIDTIIQELGVRRLAIDSVTHFKRVAHEEVHLREVLAEILNYLKIQKINALLVKELERTDDSTIAFEEYLVDASMRVYNMASPAGGENVRSVEIRKTRGQGHVSGRHPFTLDDHGITVYPNLRPRDVQLERSTERRARQRVPVGVPGLDAMLGGGLWNGSLAIVAGIPGTGKSVLAYHFLDTGLRAGEPVLLASTRQDSRRLTEQAASLGMDWTEALASGQLEVLETLPVGVSLEQVMNALHDHVRRRTPGRLVLDSIDDLWGMTRDEDRVRDALLVLNEMADRAGTTTLVLHEMRPRDGVHEVRSDYAEIACCVLQLTLAETDGELRRFLGIRKFAGGEHARELREFTIDSGGLRVKGKPTGLSGILSGETRGALTDVAERAVPALEEAARLLSELEERSGAPEDLGRLREARSKLAFLDVLLREHFGLTDFRRTVEELLEESP